MKFKGHFLSELIIFILLFIFIKEITLSMIILPIFFGTGFPDTDLKFNSHRNLLFHSILIPLFVWTFNMMILSNLLILSVGIHLLGDSKWWSKRRTKGGYFCVVYYKKKRLPTRWSVVWYLFNFLVSLGLFIGTVCTI